MRCRRSASRKWSAGPCSAWRENSAQAVGPEASTRRGFSAKAATRFSARPVLLDADGADLLEVRDAPDDLLDAVLEQRRHPVPDRLPAQLLDGLPLLDLPLHLVGGDE